MTSAQLLGLLHDYEYIAVRKRLSGVGDAFLATRARRISSDSTLLGFTLSYRRPSRDIL